MIGSYGLSRETRRGGIPEAVRLLQRDLPACYVGSANVRVRAD